MKKAFLKLSALALAALIALSLVACGESKPQTEDKDTATTSVSRYESPEGYTQVKDILSWEKINAIPVKSEGMSMEQIRQMIVDVHKLSREFVWVSNAELDYQALSATNLHKLSDGTVYGGLPYMKQGTGNIYRTMDWMDPKTGVIDIATAGKQPGLFGNMCSCSAWWGWARVVNSAEYCYSKDATLANGCIPLGEITYDETVKEFGDELGTGSIVQATGLEKMYAAYAAVQMGDGLVCNTPGSHVIMAADKANVTYNDDGSINATLSYIPIIDQTVGWSERTNEAGETYSATGNVSLVMNFMTLYEKAYIPFTFAELLGTDPIEKTEISYSHTGDTITLDQLFESKITCNYALSDVYAVITDSKGNEVYRHAVRAAYPCMMELAMLKTSPADDKDCVTVWGKLDTLSAEESYTVSIVAQIGTGERPTLWEGKLSL